MCFDLYFAKNRLWQAEILQKHAQGCHQVDFRRKSINTKIVVFKGWSFGSKVRTFPDISSDQCHEQAMTPEFSMHGS